MSGKENIDKLLKESFEHFSPDAPDVWSQIQTQVSAQAGGSAAASGKIAAAGLKSASVITKVILAVAIPAAGLISYYTFNSSPKTVQEPANEVVNPVTVQQDVQPEPSAPVQAAEPMAVETSLPKAGQPVVKPSTSAREQTGIAETRPETGNNLQPESEIAEPQVKTTLPKAGETKPVVKQEQNRQPEKPKSADKKEPVKAPVTNAGVEESEIFIADIITPDGNGLNESFVIPGVDRYFVKVVDRNGRIVFEGDSGEKVWDGTDQLTGQLCEKGVYVCYVIYEVNGVQKDKRVKLTLK